MKYVITITDEQDNIVRQQTIEAPSKEWMEQENLSLADALLLTAAPENCPFDCDYCRT